MTTRLRQFRKPKLRGPLDFRQLLHLVLLARLHERAQERAKLEFAEHLVNTSLHALFRHTEIVCNQVRLAIMRESEYDRLLCVRQLHVGSLSHE